jgi:ATP-dependent RNA helicase DeaD
MLCKAGGITKDDIGAIRVQQKESFIEIKKASVAEFVKTIGPNLRVEDDAVLTQLAKPPSIANSPRPSFSDRQQRDRKPSGNSDRGNKRKPTKPHEADHTNFADSNVSKKKPKKDKKPKKPREKSKGTPYSKDSWAKEMERLEGAVTEIKPKAASGGEKPWDKKPKSKASPSKSPSASKRGKDFSKRDKK